MGEKLVPLEDIFRDRNRVVSDAKRRQSHFDYLQSIVRTRSSLSLLELEELTERLVRVDLSFTDLVALENLVRSRVAASERVQGWHAGFGDLLRQITSLRLAKEAA